MTEQMRLQLHCFLHSLRNCNTSIPIVIPNLLLLSLPSHPTLFMVKLQDPFRMEEKQESRLHLVPTRPTEQSRTDFLLPSTLLQNWTMKMPLMESPILRPSTRMLWDTQKKNVQRTLFMYLTDTLIRVLITSTLTYSVKKN